PTPQPEPTPEPTPEPAPTPVDYVKPLASAQLTKPTYERQVKPELVRAQPRPATGTITGYNNMDTVDVVTKDPQYKNNIGFEVRRGAYGYETDWDKPIPRLGITDAFYGMKEEEHAQMLSQLKTKIDTTNIKVGVIDSGLDKRNPALVGANVHDTVVQCRFGPGSSQYEEGCGDGSTGSGIEEVNISSPTYRAGTDHGSQMASVIAGNNGYSNAKIYGSKSLENSNGGNLILMAYKLNKDHGVKIFNNSWGMTYDQYTRTRWLEDIVKNPSVGVEYDPVTGRSNFADLGALHDLIINKDALLLKATGNFYKDDAHPDINFAPKINEKFKDGFITVSSPREDYVNANLCGGTAEWCIAAPSTSTYFKNNGERMSDQGTSPATARVTGTAVLVKGAYPWMKNKNLVQTILGTARDFKELEQQHPDAFYHRKRVSVVPDYYRKTGMPAYEAYDQQGNFLGYDIIVKEGFNQRRIIKNHNG
ncbi:S8 family peptidase, partial [Moraxella equi]